MKSNIFDEMIRDVVNDLQKNIDSSEIVLNRMSHQILKWVVEDVDISKRNIAKHISKVSDENITDRLLFQYFDCIFRESINWEIEKSIQILSFELDSFKEYKNLPSHLMYSGALQMLQGKRELAYKFYHVSSFLANTYYLGLPRMYLGANSVINSTTDWVGSQKKLPAIFRNIQKYILKCNDESENLIFISADSKYFKNFKDFIFTNLAAQNSTTPLHFHIVDWEKTCDRLDFPDDVKFQIGCSYEEYRYLRDKTYFATSRFYRAYEIMNTYDKRIYISDIDNQFICEPAIFFEKVKDFDVGLRFNKNGNWFPWWGPSAGSLYVANTGFGKIFLKHLNEYISERFKVNQVRYTWWFDQLALNDVYNYCKENYPDMKFVNLSNPEYYLSIVREDAELINLKT